MKHSSLTRLTLLVCAVVVPVLVQCANSRARKTDFAQAELMIAYLRGISQGKSDSEMVDAILETKGMDLIIKQQNVMATIDKAQYRDLLSSLRDEEAPDIKPLDSTERAKLGVSRLKNNIWPSLKWAVKNVDLLEDRLVFLNDLDVGSQAKAIADSFLPEPLHSIPAIFFVMGGRAGFYAGDDCIYMHLLSMSYSPKGVKPLVESDIISFFAHEMHHVGYGELRNNKLSQLSMDQAEKRAFGFVSGLVAEGSATFLINGHRDIDFIKNHRRYAKYFGLEDDLRKICEDILQSVLSDDTKNDDDFNRAREPLLGMGYHAAGSVIMDVIYREGGKEPVMRILRDPRRLLAEYNNAARSLMEESDSNTIYLFNEELAHTIAHLGQ